MKHIFSISAVAMAAALCANSAQADDGTFEFHGYSRGGPVLSTSDGVKGRFQLGGGGVVDGAHVRRALVMGTVFGRQ